MVPKGDLKAQSKKRRRLGLRLCLLATLQDKDEKRSTARKVPSGSCVELRKGTKLRSGFLKQASC